MFFHLKAAILKWLKKNSCSLKDNQQWMDEFFVDLDRLEKEKIEDWQVNLDKVLSKWASRDTEFAQHLLRTYFGENAIFPRKIWANTFFPIGLVLSDQTTNEAESYHNSLNRCFKMRPTIKKGIKLLQLVEKKCTRQQNIRNAKYCTPPRIL